MDFPTSTNSIICLPGLGGHRSVFKEYESNFPNYNLYLTDLIDFHKTEKEILQISTERGKIIFLCNCYGAQIALRIIKQKPELISALIVIEPFYARFFFWRRPALIITRWIISILKFGDRLHIRRKVFPDINYMIVEKYPLFFQPFFDMYHQNLTDYFSKIEDILSFKMPEKIEIKTLFIFSPKGFLRNKEKRQKLLNIFVNGDVAELSGKSHNIVTLARKEIIQTVNSWIKINQIA